VAELSSVLFSIGVIFVALAFAAHIGHAVLLANGRRALPVLGVAQQPAYAGAVSGSFVTAQTRALTDGPSLAGSSSPLSRAASGLTWAAIIALGVALVLRAVVVGRGP
jgi:hypothetical protein